VKSEAFSDLLKEQVKNTQQVMQDVMQRQLAYAQYQQQYSMAMYQHAMAYQMAAAPTPKSSSKSKKLEQKDKQSGSKSQNFSSTSPKNQKKTAGVQIDAGTVTKVGCSVKRTWF